MNAYSTLDNIIVQEDLKRIYERFSERSKLRGGTILITGCAGFLGFYITSFLTHYADDLGIQKVIGLDTFKRGRPLWIQELIEAYPETLSVYPFDIARDELSSVKDIEKVDYIIHMASIASPTFYRQFPLETIDANIWGLRALLNTFCKKAIKGFLFFSSSEIYGDPEEEAIPTSEDYAGRVMSIGPRACYDESKRFGETLCFVYAQRHGLPIAIVRPFNNFGPGLAATDKRVPADFAQAILKNRDIVILSDGRPTRTFCYVADAVAGYLKALVHGRFDVFNIGSERPEITIKELAEMYVRQAEAVMGYSGTVRYEKSQEEDYLTHNPNRRCPNIDKARKLLNYEPAVSVEEGVERYLRFLIYQKGKT